MRPLIFVAITVCSVTLTLTDHAFAQSSKKNTAGAQQEGNFTPTIGSNAFNNRKNTAGAQQGGGAPTIGSNAFNNARSQFGTNNGLPPRAKTKTSEEKLADAKKKYMDVFLGKKSFEVRLSNKSLALKRGKLVGLAEQNKYAIFESTRTVVAVPLDKLSKRLEQKVEDQLDKAKAIFAETGIACDQVIEIPEDFEQKMVGLSNREKVKMFIYRKPKKDKKKKPAKDADTAKDKAESKDSVKSKDKVESGEKQAETAEDSKEKVEKG